ncbi:MAG: hypothetical protein NTU62_03950 [Spirochaetes bacterium]|nr:hypothetical protein [Spirochaetota bacterium]
MTFPNASRASGGPLAALAAVLFFAGLAPLAAQDAEPFIQVIPRTEIGYVAVLSHEYQSGTGGTRFNFVTQGGQDILFPYQRYAVDVVLAGQHRVTLLYQPLTLNTQTVVNRNTGSVAPIVIDDVSFPDDTVLDLKYGFDFWRASYLYDFARSPDTILGAGVSLQIRNASIVFSSADGTLRTIQQNIGPVPILKVRAAHQFSPAFGLDLEADGFYASSAFFNGSANPFKGWVWDAALTAKTHFTREAVAFRVVRSIGGGAEGNNAYDYSSSTTSTPGSYTYNALATLAVTLGFSIER